MRKRKSSASPASSEDQRAENIRLARVYLREARARRHAPRSFFLFLEWAGNARRRAAAAMKAPAQGELFG
jgi:hypothetical protein